MAKFTDILAKIANGEKLSVAESEIAFDILMSGEATPAQMGGFLLGLRVRGETISEITGAVRVMRSKMLPVRAPADAIDIVGTGGDGTGSYNISTCAAFITAGSGVPVAKHGNRALSSKSGAGDVLTALGVNINLTAEEIGQCIEKANIGFMFAPAHHSAMKHVGATRTELATRTIFNLLGPLSNPASVKRQLVGVYARTWIEPLAKVLSELGSERIWVVHGADGHDEITTTGITYISALDKGEITNFELDPKACGIPIAQADDLKGGDAEYNANALRKVLKGEPSAYTDTALLNAAAALVVAGKTETMETGLQLARNTIKDGKALASLEKLISLSNSFSRPSS